MIIRKSQARGRANFGWLNSEHSFSFGHYYDPENMGFGPLRVINEDKVEPGQGFGMHGHENMEIISYVVEGALEHKDSIGTGSTIVPGEVQCMSAGSGIRHSEYNPSSTQPVHFLQIWIIPDKQGLTPSYEQKRFFASDENNPFRLIASPDRRHGSLLIHQDVFLYAGKMNQQSHQYTLEEGRIAWLQLIKGTCHVNGEILNPGDGVSFDEPGEINLSNSVDCEFLLFDMTNQSNTVH